MIFLALGVSFIYSVVTFCDFEERPAGFVHLFSPHDIERTAGHRPIRNHMENALNRLILTVIAPALLIGAPESLASQNSRCTRSDTVCIDFERLAAAGHFDAIIKKIDAATQYSEGSRRYIGNAYLALAGSDENTPEQEEVYCRKALEYGFNQAYMGLYFLHAQKDQDKALGFLKQYVETKPKDSVPYVILGESELEKKNYRLADIYLRESKGLARARSARVDWMLFQANYLLGNFQYAAEALESAFKNGRFEQELKELAAEARFQGIDTHPQFTKFFTVANRPQ